MKSSTMALAAVVFGLTTLPGLSAAQAAPAQQAAQPVAQPAASLTVTIDAEGLDMFGTVRSSNPARCAANRTVKVFKLVNGEPHLWASDTTQLQGNTYVWSTGQTGSSGRFYAKVKAKTGCQGDKSPIIRLMST